MAYKLVCIEPLHGFRKGEVVTDEAAVERLSASHPHHFIRTIMPDVAPAPTVAPAPEAAE